MGIREINITIVLSCLLLFWDYPGVRAEMGMSTDNTLTWLSLDREWSYHWGDFGLDAQDRPLDIETPAAWTPYPDNPLLGRSNHTFLRMKRTLQDIAFPNPAIFVPPFSTSQTFEVYLDHTLIYRAGELRATFTTRHAFMLWHLISLPADCAGKTLLFRFYSNHPNVIGLLGKMYIGERNTLFDQFILADLDLTVFGLIFMLTGLLGYGVFIKVYAQKNIPVLAFATLATFSGVYLLVDASYISQLFVAQSDILFYGWHVSFFLFMAGIYAFFESTIGSGRKRIYRLFWQFQVGCLLLFILCDLLYIVAVNTYLLSIMGASLGILVGGVDTVKQIRQGSREARILGMSFGVFGVTGLVSMWSDRYLATGAWKVYPYGLLIVLVSLAYLLILRYQTERRLAEDSVRHSEERLAGIVGALTDAITIIDAQGHIVWTNEIAKALFESVPRGKNQTALDVIAACFQDGQPREYEVVLMLPDGGQKDFWCTVSVAAWHEDGRPRLIIEVLRDITAMKALQAEAARAAHLAALGELSAGVAHEINNPISGIIGYAELLADECAEHGTSPDIPDRILQEGQRIARIVGNLLSFAHEQPHAFSPTRIEDLLADVLMLTAKLFQKSGITIQLDIPQTLPMVMADGQQIQQVFLNLLNNARYALEHTSSEKKEAKILIITCQLVENNGRQYVRTIFHDNGMGIPENILDKICDPFYTTKPIGEGTGLGLSISYGILKNHDGYISFESQAGLYTKALVDLPVIQEDEPLRR